MPIFRIRIDHTHSLSIYIYIYIFLPRTFLLPRSFSLLLKSFTKSHTIAAMAAKITRIINRS